MSHKLHDVFPTLKVYVPAVLTGKRLKDSIIGLESLDKETLALVANVASQASSLLEHFGSNVVTSGELPGLFAPVQQSLYELLQHVHADYQALTLRATDAMSEETVRWQLPDGTPELHNGYNVCDHYFRFVRVKDMQAREWLGTLVFVSLAVVEDLPHTLLNWDEEISLLAALTEMFSWILPEGMEVESNSQSGKKPLVAEAKLPLWQSEAENVGRTISIAYYRLLIGHHIWQHFNIFARECFEHSADEFAKGNDQQGTQWLWKATRLFRGTTASMWYASIFPLQTYQAELRPTMVETESIDAQQQHLTYNLLKQAIKQFKITLEERVATNQPLQSEQAYTVLKQFHEYYVQDMEQHILVAASKVGLDASLAQKIWQSKLPANTRAKNAMDLLRDMAGLRRKDWQKVLSIPVAQAEQA
ncbi:MAG: hypothetical protein U0Z26_15045 [Anaerolineales bacterium]